MTVVEKNLVREREGCSEWRDPLLHSVEPKAAVRIIRGEDLNNFFCNLPGGVYRSEQFLSLFLPGETYGDGVARGAREEGRELRNEELEGYSARKMSETPEEFFASIDDALVKCGIDGASIRYCIESLVGSESRRREQWEIVRTIHSAVLPAYIVLRHMGYSHRDLAG